MRQHAGDALQIALSELERDGWEVDYLSLSGKADIESVVKFATIQSVFIFDPEKRRLGIDFSVLTEGSFRNSQKKAFLQRLCVNLLKRRMELRFGEQGTFSILWSVYRPRMFREENPIEFRNEIHTQVKEAYKILVPCLHVLRTFPDNEEEIDESAKESLHPLVEFVGDLWVARARH